MISSLWLGEIRPRSSEMLHKQREIFAKAKVINYKNKIVGVDVLDDPLSITLFACMELHLGVYGIVLRTYGIIQGMYGITPLCVWASPRRPDR